MVELKVPFQITNVKTAGFLGHLKTSISLLWCTTTLSKHENFKHSCTKKKNIECVICDHL